MQTKQFIKAETAPKKGFSHTLKAALCTLKHNNSGAIILEFALIVPLFVLIMGGVFEVTMYVISYNKLVRVANLIGDTITRSNQTPTNILAIMGTTNILFQPFQFNPNGSVTVTHVRNSKLSNLPSDMLITWQYSTGSSASTLGNVGQLPKNLPNNISVISNQTMVITEIFFEYKPLVFHNIVNPKSIYVTSVFVPRSGDMNTLLS